MVDINTIRKAFEVYDAPIPSTEVCDFIALNYEPNELLRIANKIITFELLMHRSSTLEDVKKMMGVENVLHERGTMAELPSRILSKRSRLFDI